MSGDELDEAIDAAVRDMLRAEPPAGLRHRVVRRLAEPEPRRVFTTARLAAVAALVVCVAVGTIIVRRGSEGPAVGRVAVSSTAPASAPAAPAARESSPAAVATAAGARPAGQSRLPETARTANAARSVRLRGDRLVSATSLLAAEPTVQIAPLDPLKAIATAPVGTDRLHIEEIAIAPLQMEPVRVDPLLSSPR